MAQGTPGDKGPSQVKNELPVKHNKRLNISVDATLNASAR